ncbi:MAG TPA: hypothetical protein P5318_10245 [Candidatus Hydrogenedentes bacterium]|nr:hypothetical protein [Candidatus Hydrogenedentota bacterium]HRT20495.1 hypothetical protein [Candidatus Hydrogenedentota bacterium]HRT65170.1 hypothetical protein [Candidatus Hydrogenedentota bacterium]
MEKSFDAVGFMRRRRIEIDQETEGLSWAERNQYILESLRGDPLWERLKDRTIAPAPYTSPDHATMASEAPGRYGEGAGTPAEREER